MASAVLPASGEMNCSLGLAQSESFSARERSRFTRRFRKVAENLYQGVALLCMP
jgi:hypothetical protein